MAYPYKSVANAIINKMRARGESISPLKLQKLLYYTCGYYLAASGGRPLIDHTFEAWDYGPVLPSLYHSLKMFGRKPIKNVFWHGSIPDGTSQAEAIDAIASQISGLSPGQLVEFTHHENGAWAKHYRPGARNVLIPNQDIIAEYEWRTKQAA